jgi:hypothetical protein
MPLPTYSKLQPRLDFGISNHLVMISRFERLCYFGAWFIAMMTIHWLLTDHPLYLQSNRRSCCYQQSFIPVIANRTCCSGLPPQADQQVLSVLALPSTKYY